MENKPLDEAFWSAKYLQNQTGWDLASVSPPIKSYFDQCKNKDLRILIPGCGNGYEAEYLVNQGFTQTTVVDLSSIPLKHLKQRAPSILPSQLIQGDFFQLNGLFDLIVEQTFFCAISPVLRMKYVKKCYDLLCTNGKVVGLLFNRTFPQSGPPFGGSKEEYMKLFQPYFDILTMEDAYNSIPPRMGSEVFVILQKKD